VLVGQIAVGREEADGSEHHPRSDDPRAGEPLVPLAAGGLDPGMMRENEVAANITPAPNPSIMALVKGRTVLTRNRTGTAPSPVARPAMRPAMLPIQISEAGSRDVSPGCMNLSQHLAGQKIFVIEDSRNVPTRTRRESAHYFRG
jgi:hypothetical protein